MVLSASATDTEPTDDEIFADGRFCADDRDGPAFPMDFDAPVDFDAPAEADELDDDALAEPVSSACAAGIEMIAAPTPRANTDAPNQLTALKEPHWASFGGTARVPGFIGCIHGAPVALS